MMRATHGVTKVCWCIARYTMKTFCDEGLKFDQRTVTMLHRGQQASVPSAWTH